MATEKGKGHGGRPLIPEELQRKRFTIRMEQAQLDAFVKCARKNHLSFGLLVDIVVAEFFKHENWVMELPEHRRSGTSWPRRKPHP